MISPTEWRPQAGLELEPNARVAVVEQTRNVLVVAGPGAGKTEMLAQRADFLLRTGLCPYPRRILAISFKVDAAENLRARVTSRCGTELARRLDSHTFHAFAKRLIDRYRVVLTGADALNYDYTVGPDSVHGSQLGFPDMVPRATTILESSAIVRNAVRNTYSHVFLDEFQDCTNVQYQFLRTAFGATNAVITAVGDTKQSIMGWAGALDKIFEKFVADSDADIHRLYVNHRSATRIRRVNNAMVKVMEPAAAVPDTELTHNDGIVEPVVYSTCADEAADLADRIASWIHDEQVVPSEIAVLVSREVAQYAAPLMAQLDARSIAYRNEHVLQDDFAQPVGQLIVDFLAVTLHAHQTEAYQRLVDVLAVNSGDDETDDRHAAKWRRILSTCRSAVEALVTSDEPGDALVAVVRTFLDHIGPERLTALSPEYGQGDRLAQVVESVLSRVRTLANGLGGTLADLTQITDDGAVRILTVHKSKGLEFDSVIVLATESETYWSKPDDERATFFVGVSRAKRRLIATAVQHRAKPPSANHHWKTTRTPHHEFLKFVAAGETPSVSTTHG